MAINKTMACLSPTLLSREQLLSRMRNGECLDWDLIVIGGGITGAGVLREASRRGYRTLLLEQRDFSWGTSSRSSKMVHGGLRYLASGDLRLTRQALRERERLLKEAPGLVERIAFYFTLGKGLFPGRWAMHFILTLYDYIAGIRDHRYCSNKQLRQRFDKLNTDNLNGAYYYTDALVDDSRLVLRVLQESIAVGGKALNYTKVSDLIIEQTQVKGVVIEDVATGHQIKIRARAVISATGAWADQLRNLVNREQRIRPLRGSHLVIPKQLCPLTEVLTFLHAEDKRGVFIYPWEGATIIGTTDLDHPQDLDAEASISEQEMQYLIDGFNSQFPQTDLKRSDIISTWAGVRPVIGSEKTKDPSKERRDHAVWCDNGLITVSGGKLTTFRLIALDAMAAARPLLPEAKPFSHDRLFTSTDINIEDLGVASGPWGYRLLGRYGSAARDLLEQAPPEEREPIANSQFCLAECRWALREESVIHLDDLLLRRTRLGMLLANGGEPLFAQLKAMCCSQLGWTEQQWQAELARYKSIWQQHYSLPTC